MFIKPAAGGMIRWPHTFVPLRDEGEHVPEDSYWLRALAQGCVERAEPPADQDEPDASVAAANTDAPTAEMEQHS